MSGPMFKFRRSSRPHRIPLVAPTESSPKVVFHICSTINRPNRAGAPRKCLEYTWHGIEREGCREGEVEWDRVIYLCCHGRK